MMFLETKTFGQIDKEPPIIDGIEGNTSEYTISKKIVVNARDLKSGIADEGYSFDGGETWQSSNSKIFTKNGTVKIKVRDKVGNISKETETELTTIDSTIITKSTIKATAGGTEYTSGTWTNQDIILEAIPTPSDASSGYNYQWYKKVDSSYTSSGTIVVNGSKYVAIGTGKTLKLSQHQTATYKVEIWTKAGSAKVKSEEFTVKIDKVAPTCEWSGENTTWTTATQTIKATCKDSESGCATETKIWPFSTTTKTASLTYTATDKVGNSKTCTKTANVYVDISKPNTPTSVLRYGSSTGTVRTNANTWTNQTLWWGSFNATDNGGAGINHYEYSTGCTGTKSGNLNTSHTYSSNSNYTFCIRSVDNAGNASAWSSAYYIKVDKSAPNTPTSVLRYGSSTGTVRTNANTWANETLWWGSFNATDNGGAGINHYEYSTGCTGTKSGNLNTSHTYSSDTNYTFCIRSVDNAGNASAWSGAYYIKVDKCTNPTNVNEVSYGACSKTCGGGTRKKTTVTKKGISGKVCASTTATESCNTQACSCSWYMDAKRSGTTLTMTFTPSDGCSFKSITSGVCTLDSCKYTKLISGSHVSYYYPKFTCSYQVENGVVVPYACSPSPTETITTATSSKYVFTFTNVPAGYSFRAKFTATMSDGTVLPAMQYYGTGCNMWDATTNTIFSDTNYDWKMC